MGQQGCDAFLRRGGPVRFEAHAVSVQPSFDNGLKPDKCPATNDQNILGVHLDEFLMGMFAAALWRDACHLAFKNFQKCLLYPFARDIPSDGWVLGFAADFVDLININYAGFGTLDIAVRRLNQF